MRKSAIRITCFLLLLACVMSGVNQVLSLKDYDGAYGTQVVTVFYGQEENSIDVLILGSSHAYESFNTGVLWEEYGMASYVLAGPHQPMWNTYYYLKEALKTQKPELIVLEAYMTRSWEEYETIGLIQNTYGLKWSADRVAAVKVSAPQERWKEFLPEYVQYHSRYKELAAGDFLEYNGYPPNKHWKGFNDNMLMAPQENPDVSRVSEREELFDKTEKYYRMIIELAQENNIPIVVVMSPFANVSEKLQKRFNRAQDVAEEYGVEFINYNLCYKDIGIDFATDAADVEHLNFSGNRKFSTAVGRYLTEHYEISDRRGDSRYQSWQDEADFIRANRKDRELCEAADRETFLERVQNEDYLYFISTRKCDIKNENIHTILNTFGISYNGTNEIWQADSNGVEWMSGEQEAERYRRIDQHDILLKRTWNEKDEEYVNEIIIDAENHQTVRHGVNVTVYSTVTQKVVDSVGFDADNDYQLVR